MASTNKTTNYELSQFQSTDIPGWLTDYNGDMQKIDAGIHAAKVQADGAASGVSALQTAVSGKQDTLTFDTTPASGSNNPVTSGGIYNALQNVSVQTDAVPTEGSTKAVQSGGVYTALAGKQNTLTFDSAPTPGSSNPVTSGGIYSALSQVTHKTDFCVRIYPSQSDPTNPEFITTAFDYDTSFPETLDLDAHDYEMKIYVEGIGVTGLPTSGSPIVCEYMFRSGSTGAMEEALSLPTSVSNGKFPKSYSYYMPSMRGNITVREGNILQYQSGSYTSVFQNTIIVLSTNPFIRRTLTGIRLHFYAGGGSNGNYFSNGIYLHIKQLD